jgi:hypothetical protein
MDVGRTESLHGAQREHTRPRGLGAQEQAAHGIDLHAGAASGSMYEAVGADAVEQFDSALQHAESERGAVECEA